MATTDQDMLDAVEAAIMAQVTGNVTRYSVGSQSFEKLPLDELVKMRKDLKRQINRRKDSGVRLAGLGR